MLYRIVRFFIEDTIEERILKLQEKKELMFEGYSLTCLPVVDVLLVL